MASLHGDEPSGHRYKVARIYRASNGLDIKVHTWIRGRLFDDAVSSGDTSGDAGDAGQGDAGQSGNANNLITLGDGQLTGSQAGEYLVDYDPAGGTNGSGEYALTLLTVDGNGAYSETSMVFHVDAGTQIQDATMIQAGLGTGSYLDPATIATTQGSGDTSGDFGPRLRAKVMLVMRVKVMRVKLVMRRIRMTCSGMGMVMYSLTRRWRLMASRPIRAGYMLTRL